MTSLSYSWLQQVTDTLIETTKVPLWGNVPSFPWEEFSKRLFEEFKLDHLKIHPSTTQWRSSEEIVQGFGKKPIQFTFECTSLNGKCHWLLASEDVMKLSSFILSPTQKMKGFSDPRFQEGFYSYLSIKSLEVLEQLKVFKNLSFKLVEPHSLPEEGALCLDIVISYNDETIYGRLVYAKKFKEAFINHYKDATPSLLSNDCVKEIIIDLKIQAGATDLNLSEWERVNVGDFILLDDSSLDPISQIGSVKILFENTPLFKAKFKKNKIKILNYIFQNEEGQIMSKKFSEPKDENFDDEEEDFEEGDEEHDGDEEEEDHDDDFDLDLDEDEEEDDDDQDEEQDDDEEEGDEDEHLSSADGNIIAESLESHSSAHSLEKKMADIPITLTVEIGKLKMNVEKLLQLTPGNLIELNTKLEYGVDLTINGKKVAKGELIKLGDALGVKVLSFNNR